MRYPSAFYNSGFQSQYTAKKRLVQRRNPTRHSNVKAKCFWFGMATGSFLPLAYSDIASLPIDKSVILLFDISIETTAKEDGS